MSTKRCVVCPINTVTLFSLTISHRWLRKNSLSALKLTLTDALGPAAIPHTPKRVPILDRKVPSKVFETVFHLAHITSNNQVSLVNPNGVDLKAYEEKVRHQIDIYWDRLTKLAQNAIPVNQRDSLCAGQGSEVTLCYKEQRYLLRNAMEKLGWPQPQVNFDLLEEEIERAENFVKYSKLLREEGRIAECHLSLKEDKDSRSYASEEKNTRCPSSSRRYDSQHASNGKSNGKE